MSMLQNIVVMLVPDIYGALFSGAPGAQFSGGTWRVTVNNSLRRRLQACIYIWPMIIMKTNAAFHWTREVVITSSRAVKQRSIDVVNSWTRNHDRWTRVGFVHLEFTVGVAPWHDIMQFKVDWI